MHSWITLAAAIIVMVGYELSYAEDRTLQDGSYGSITVDCGGGGGSLKAAHERQVLVSAPLIIQNCHGMVVEGLHVKGSNGGWAGDGLVEIRDSDSITFRRNLIETTNQAGDSLDSYANQHGVYLSRTNNSLIEENELYWFHRHGILLGQASGNVIRRNYANSRGCSPGGCHKRFSDGHNICAVSCDKADSGFIMYTGSENTNNIFENNISEGNGTVLFFNGHYTHNHDNKAFGNISLNDDYGIQVEQGEDEGADGYVSDALVQDHLVLNASKVGMPIGARSLSVNRATILNTSGCCGGGSGVVATQGSISLSNILSAGNASSNFSLNGRSCSNCSENLPSGGCTAGATSSGTGAQVVTKYEQGQPTLKTLWTPSFAGCGAKVSGVNDISGSSCFDVQDRLAKNLLGCGGPPKKEFPPPKNFRIVKEDHGHGKREQGQ
jgi:parallel beta-helix repeat protein